MARPHSVTTSLRRYLDSLSRVVAVVDSEGVLVYANVACADWTGIAAQQLIGVVCQYHGTPDIASPQGVAAALCPPPEVAAGQMASATIALPGGGGAPSERRLVFLPLTDDDGEYDGAIAVEQTSLVADAVAAACSSASDTAALHDQLRRMRAALSRPYRVDRVVGTSVATCRLRNQLAVAAQTDCNVLVVGPTGSHREDVARTVYYAGNTARCAGSEYDQQRLIPFACGLVDAELIESTLESFARADVPAGVLLLGDVDQLSADGQALVARLLRRRQNICRVLATARTDLTANVASGEFRDDLAGMLGTLTITLGALRERAEDVPYLAQLYLEDENAGGEKQLSGFSPEALDCLSAYDWPGDVAELAALVARLHVQSETATVRSRDLPAHIRTPGPRAADVQQQESIVLDEYIAGIELELIQRALRRAKGNKAQAARSLGMTRPRLYRRLVQLGLESNKHLESNEREDDDDNDNNR
jgi:DNA-binding NtrC family response regulator